MSFNVKELLIASYLEAQKSPDLSTQVGALLVGANGEIVSSGFNSFPSRVRNTEVRQQRPKKYLYTEHAERNAILNAAKKGIQTDNLILVCAWAACADCARAIINSGIKTIVRHPRKSLGNDMDGRWSASITAGDEMFYESGVVVIEVAPVQGYFLLRDGVLCDTAVL